MALTMKDTGLVAGVPLTGAPVTAVKALRGFFDEGGMARKAGELFTCSERFARSLIAVNKAERVELPKGGIVPQPVIHSEPDSIIVLNVDTKASEEKPSRRRGRRLTNED